MTQIRWNDLLIENVSDPNLRLPEILRYWDWLLTGRFGPHALSKFGDCFFQRPDGSIHVLDVVEGEVRLVADSHSAFMLLVNTQSWQEENLLSFLIWQMHELNMIPTQYQSYAFKLHPILGGDFTPENVIIMEMPIWQHICSELHKQVRRT